MGWLFAFLIGIVLFSVIAILVDSRGRLMQEKGDIQQERDRIAEDNSRLMNRMSGVLNADAERAKVIAEAKQIGERFNKQLAEAKAKYASYKSQREDELRTLDAELAPLRVEHKILSDEVAAGDMGFFKSVYAFATSEKYKQTIEANWRKQKAMLTEKTAAQCSQAWTVNGSTSEGKKQSDKTLSLMLRAFNGDCDAVIAKVKATNYKQMEARIEKAFETINKMGSKQFCEISTEYKTAKLEELRLEVEHAQKLAAEREEQRSIREEMRQQAVAEKEWEKAQDEAEREEERFGGALERARRDAENASAAKQAEMLDRVRELEAMVAEAHAKKERAISMAQQTRAGVVYIISNIGSFGTNVYKIGMTRRRDPMDRVWELSDASVPFDFDVHAIIRTDDAPSLENELHRRFADRRINVVNERKEFFQVTIHEIAQVVREQCGDIELTLIAEAAEFMQSEAYRLENGPTTAASRLFAIAGVAIVESSSTNGPPQLIGS